MGASASERAPTIGDAQDRHPLREMLAIAAPSVVTMTSYTVMQFVDGLMVSRIGDDPVYVAAQGNGGIVVWIMMSAALGLLSIVNSFVSQNLGAGHPKRGAAYGWNAIWLSAIASVVILPSALLWPLVFEHLMHHEGDLLRFETEYASILIMGAFVTLASRGLAHYFYGMHRPTVVMCAALLAQVVNVFLNAVFIFGAEGMDPARLAGAAGLMPFFDGAAGVAHFLGIDAMGVAGAAVGTVVGNLVELAIPLAIFVSPAFNRRYGTRAVWRPSLRHMKDLVRVGWPAGLMFANELVCWGILMSYLLGKAGAAAGDDPVVHNTAGWIALRYMHLSFMPCVGLSIGVTAIVGRCIGAGRRDLAASRTWLGLRLGMAYMGLCALLFVIFRERLVALFIPETAANPELLIRVGSRVMIAAAVFQVFDALAIIISGALRGAGDTVYPGIVTVVLSWTCIVGGGLAAIALFPELGSTGPWIGAAAYIIVLGITLVVRFLGGRWRTIALLKQHEDAPLVPPALPLEPVGPDCLSCGFDLADVSPDAQGRVVCPACGGVGVDGESGAGEVLVRGGSGGEAGRVGGGVGEVGSGQGD